MLSESEVVDLVADTMLPAFGRELLRLNRIDRWWRGANDLVTLPDSSTREQRELREVATVPILRLVVAEVAQAMFVEGYRLTNAGDGSAGGGSVSWRLWTENDFESRQDPLHEAMLAYGIAYTTVLPGVLNGDRSVAIRPHSPRQMLAFYDDPVADEWPQYGLRVVAQDRYVVYDADVVYHLTRDVDPAGGARLRIDRIESHEAGVCPIVRFANMDLEGRSPGEIEPNIPLARSLDKTKYDRHLIQHYNSFKVRTATGVEQPRTSNDVNDDGDDGGESVDVGAANVLRQRIANDSVLIGESPDTRFGTLPETQMDSILKAFEVDIKTLAAVTQTPVYALVGDLINVGEDGLAAARASADAKLERYQRVAGRSYARQMRLACAQAGASSEASDIHAGPKWADKSIRSFSTAADALGKLHSMLGVPAEALWSLIPGVSEDDVDEWRRLNLATTDDPISVIAAEAIRTNTTADTNTV